jgi:hypothetical protein
LKLLEKTDDDILLTLNPIMDNLMDASTKIDYERFIIDFSQRMKNLTTEKSLNEICKDYQAKKGFFTNREFVFLFRREDSIAVIWKQNFSKVKGDYVAEAVFLEEDERVVVDHAFVF